MKHFLLGLLKYLKIILLVLSITCVTVIVVSTIFKLKFSDIFLYTGIGYMGAGAVAFINDSSNYKNPRVIPSNFTSEFDAPKRSNKSIAFCLILGTTGLLLLLISTIVNVTLR